MAQYEETDHITDCDGEVFIVLTDECRAVEGDCDIFVIVDGKNTICIPGNKLRGVLAKLNAFNVDDMERYYESCHKYPLADQPIETHLL